MEEKRYDVNAVRKRLEEYVLNEQDIDNEIERLEHLNAKMTSISAQVLNGMPRSTNASTDRMADMLGRQEELEASIRSAVARQAEERRKLEEIIRHLRNADERAIIRTRYLDRTSWNEVLDILFGGKPDFIDKEDSYRRRMFKVHGAALINMARYIEESDEQNTAIPAT